MMQDFHSNDVLVKGSNPSFICLIPNKEHPQRIEDYRLISLISGAYKIIANIITDRLSKVMDQVIGDNQIAFIKGRNIMDGIFILNEVMEEAKKGRFRDISSRWTSERPLILSIGATWIPFCKASTSVQSGESGSWLALARYQRQCWLTTVQVVNFLYKEF